MATTIFRTLALALGLTAATSASAMRGDELAQIADAWERVSTGKSADADDAMKANLFIGYVRGVEDSLQGVRFCITPQAQFNNRAALIIKYIRDNPSEKNNGAPTFIVQALQPVFQCRAVPPPPETPAPSKKSPQGAASKKPAAEPSPEPYTPKL